MNMEEEKESRLYNAVCGLLEKSKPSDIAELMMACSLSGMLLIMGAFMMFLILFQEVRI